MSSFEEIIFDVELDGETSKITLKQLCENYDAFKNVCGVIISSNQINKQKVREAFKEIEHYIVGVQMSESDWKQFLKALGLEEEE